MTLSETPMPLFYQKPVPLNTELHAAMTLGASPQGYRFAAGSQTVLMVVVDEKRLTQLPDTDIVRLFRSGMLGLIHAHLLSLRNLDRLPALKQARSTSVS
jgi:hypothetical protein